MPPATTTSAPPSITVCPRRPPLGPAPGPEHNARARGANTRAGWGGTCAASMIDLVPDAQTCPRPRPRRERRAAAGRVVRAASGRVGTRGRERGALAPC
jgi:hypothetical protein